MAYWGGVVVRYPNRILLACLLVTLACLYPAWHLLTHLDADILNQVSEKLPRFRTMRDLSKDFGGDILLAIVSIPDEKTGDPQAIEALKQFGDLLAAELSQAGVGLPLPEEVNARPGEPWLRQVRSREGEDLAQSLQELVRQHPSALLTRDEVATFAQRFEPNELRARLKSLPKRLAEEDVQGIHYQKIQQDPLSLAAIVEEAQERRLHQRPMSLHLGSGGYHLSPDQTTLLVLARPVGSPSNVEFSRALMREVQNAENRAVDAFRALKHPAGLTASRKGDVFTEYAKDESATPDLKIGYTGMYAITTENDLSLRSDVLSNAYTSILTMILFFILVYGRVRLALDIGLTMVVASIITLALALLLHGPIGILGAAFTCVLLGIGVDQGIHQYTTYQALRSERGMSPDAALRASLIQCSPSIVAASLTNVVPFIGIATIKFKGMAELGLLAGVGLLVTTVVMIVLFPVLLLRHGQGAVHVAAPIRKSTVMLGKFHDSHKRNWIGLALGLLVAALCAVLVASSPDPRYKVQADGAQVSTDDDQVLGVRFDGEFGNLRSLSIKAIPLRDVLVQKFGLAFTDIKVMAEGPSDEVAFAAAAEGSRRLQPYLQAGELISSGGVAEFLNSPSTQAAAIQAMQALDFPELRARFLGVARELFPRVTPEEYFEKFLARLDEVAQAFQKAHVLKLEELLDGPLGTLIALQARVDGEGTERRVRLVGNYFPAGKMLHFASDWADQLEEAVSAPIQGGGSLSVTSTRMVGFELKESLFFDTQLISVLVLVAVIALLYVSFGTPGKVALVLLPVVFSMLFLLGGVAFSTRMGWDFSLNYVNILAFPMLIGSAIDYGVYLVHDIFSSRRPDLFEVVSETGRGVLLCGLTTLAGFGSMIWASYTGLISFGWAAVLGYSGALFGALIVLPSIMSLLGVGVHERDRRFGKPPAAGNP